jgi:hypothetical protein
VGKDRPYSQVLEKESSLLGQIINEELKKMVYNLGPRFHIIVYAVVGTGSTKEIVAG